jgi:N-carbamoyl-L-amino-acid hydrolase
VTIDDMGAMFARAPGQRADIPPIGMGSHLDTQPTGGKFDGALGVLAALEALRSLREAGYETFAPIEVINWTNEEGARFQPAMMASGVFAGVFTREFADNCRDRAGVRFGDALDGIGYRGSEKSGQRRLSAFFELHIEQGPILEHEGKDIGIVTGAQGIRWYELTIAGQESHAGTTPMPRRRDALLGAARLIEAVHAIATDHAPLGVGTVGVIEIKSPSPNVIPGDVFHTADLRHPDLVTLDAMEAALAKKAREIGQTLKLEIAIKKISDFPPVKFDEGCIAAVREAAKTSGFSTRDIVSGAGHDAVYIARVAPTAMVFVPCKDGISHNEIEFSSKEQCAAGAQVLLQAVLNYDRLLAEKYGK